MLQELKDHIAAVESMLDQAQAFFDNHKHLLTEDEAWHQQALIDKQRFRIGVDKLTAQLLTDLL